MNNNLPVLVLDNAYILPTSELRMDSNSKADRKLFSLAESYYNSNILIVHHNGKNKPNLDNLPRVGIIALIKLHMDLPNGKLRWLLKDCEESKYLTMFKVMY